MGWTVLYIAFGIVALWLLGEVLLQYKARLRWRVLAFAGFLGVVVGVLLTSVVVIALGAAAFAVGQTFVTLSFRRGFSTGWALGGSPGVSRRRRSAPVNTEREPTLEVSDLSYESSEPPTAEPPHAPEAPEVYEPQPLPDETGQYGIYTDDAYAARQQEQAPHQSYAPYGADPTGYGAYDPYGQHQQVGHGGQYDFGSGQDYPAYSDPYAGGQQYAASYGGYDAYGAQQPYADPYAQQYGETPPGGVWVPEQRDGDQQMPPMPQEQPSPYGYDAGSGHNEQQYRY
ncbi:hypothetical protein ACLB9X_01485 [Streptomyces sp. 5K101]|uniref:hypothetical protein n=1 Tax=Streptomyces sp. 5K101 TaxID=3390037 RepID=UPI0039767E06